MTKEKGMLPPYRIIRSRRKTVGFQVNTDAELIVRAPNRISVREIEGLLEKHRAWIEEKLSLMREKMEHRKSLPVLSQAELEDMARKALKVIPQRVEHFAKLVGVTYGRITIRNQKTRWGSCSSKGNLNFNVKLMLVPPEVLDYVVVHELCHRLEMNHSAGFWAEVERVIPDYRERRKWLRENEHQLSQ